MPSVPNWIPRAVVIMPSGSRMHPDEAFDVKDWRATRTQVVVTLANANRTEHRFYLDGLRPVGSSYRDRRIELLDGADPDVQRRLAFIRADRAVNQLETMVNLAPFGKARGDAGKQLDLAVAIRDAATAAIEALEPLL
jgi:hypothetical protein